MRRADAPPPGWYPDPTGGSQLWWWDGLDWTDHRRAPPTAGSSELSRHVAATAEAAADPSPSGLDVPSRRPAARTRDETAAIMAEVRKVAREEVDRAVDRVSDRARDATRRLEPLISQYGDRAMRWIRNLGIVAVALVVLWMLLQTFAQASLMDWIGERVDNLLGTGTSLPVRALIALAAGT